MNLSKLLFWRKKKEDYEDKQKNVTKEEIINQMQSINHKPINSEIVECFYCKNNIELHELRRNFGGKYYHKKCFRKIMKLAKKEVGA